MRVLISGGGTGGHVYPALAVAAQLPKAANEQACPGQAPAGNAKAPEHTLLWVGSNDGMEQALVEHGGLPFQGIDTGKVRGVNPFIAMTSVGKMVAGVRQSLALLRQFQPDVCFVTGGYVCTPVALACRLRGVPVLIYLPDMKPGWAIRLLSLLAQRVAVTFPAVVGYFGGAVPKGKAVVTGYPVRAELVCATGGGRLSAEAHAQNRASNRQQLAEQLQKPLGQYAADGQTLPLVLVWGGSQGSRNINQATWQALPQLLPHAQILHVVGTRDWPLWQRWQAEQPLLPAQADHYHPVEYLHEAMILALAAADLTVARAGASSLGEFPVARLPAVLVPLLGVNQLQNAELLAKEGAAVIVADAELAQQLTPTVLALLQDPSRRLAMENALAKLAEPDAALNIARELCRLVSV